MILASLPQNNPRLFSLSWVCVSILAGWCTSTQPHTDANSDANSDAKYQKITKRLKIIGINVVTSSTALLISSQDD